MRVPKRVLLFVAILTMARAASDWPLPPLDGEVSGDVVATTLPDAPPLHWRVAAQSTGEHTRHVVVRVTGPGTDVRLEADVNLANRIATWTLADSKFDLARWAVVLSREVPALAGNTLVGTLSVTGSGVVQDNKPSGTIAVSVQEAAVRNAAGGWSLDGISLNGPLAVDAASVIRSAGPLTLSVRTITTKRFGARNLTVNGMLQDLQTFALSAARIEIAGGDMVAAPATIELQPFRVALDVTVNRIGLQDVAALVPTALLSARGRVDGTMRIGWTAKNGIELGNGHLILRPDEPAQVTLKPFPGLLTGGLPTWIMKLPPWLVRWSIPNLREAELGRAPIDAQSLDVTFSPQPDSEGRTAVAHLVGVPNGATARTPVNITANVYGPLNALIHLGTKTNFTLGVH